MANQQSVSVKPEQLLSLAIQALHQCFYETQRDQAKQLFKEIDKGSQSELFKIKLNNGREIQGNVSLDKSEFIGKFSYSCFRSALAVMINRISEKLQAKEELNILSSDQTGEILFNIPGFVEQDGQVNVLVLAVSQQSPGFILLRLMFLDPEQFQQQQ